MVNLLIDHPQYEQIKSSQIIPLNHPHIHPNPMEKTLSGFTNQ